MIPKKKDKEAKNVVNESVQAGVPNVKYATGHYMFDPTKDAMDETIFNQNDQLAFIRSAWMNETNNSKVQKDLHNIIQGNLNFNQ